MLRHGAAHADPRTVVSYWRAWNDFEVAHGNEDTFRAMLRVKATVAQQYKNTNYAIAAPEAPGAAAAHDDQEAPDDVQADGNDAPGPLKRDLVEASEVDWARETSAPGKRARLHGAPEDEDEEGEQQQPQQQQQQREGDAGVRRVQVPSTLFGDAMAKAAEERAAAQKK